MNPETLRRFYRIYPSGEYMGGMLEFRFSPLDRRYPKQEFTLRYSIMRRDFDAVSTVKERKGSRSAQNETDPAPLVAALPPRVLADLVTKSLAQEAAKTLTATHYLHGVEFKFTSRPSVIDLVAPTEIPPLTEITFKLERDPAEFGLIAKEMFADTKENVDAPEDGRGKQVAGRQDGTHVRATVFRGDDCAEGDR
jgi:hypothetical protein